MVFKLDKIENGVRKGTLNTMHGVLKTPFFMPVGTQGTVKGITNDELRMLGAQIVLSNTYHLYLRPGEQLIKKLGGLHEFMRWDGPILTDSGGYQVFSLGKRKDNDQLSISNFRLNSKSKNPKQLQATSYKLKKSLVKILDEGVEFTSYLDGSKHLFTPEKVVQIQLDLGVDIIMPLDVCPSGKATRDEIKKACEITIEWAVRSKSYFDAQIDKLKVKSKNCNSKVANPKKLTPKKLAPLLFGIVQGGLDSELRKYCADELIKLDFDGYAVGGLAVDNETRDMWATVKLMGEILPSDKPRYLMGVGTPDDINRGIHLGMDMFDCVLPTRLGRHGSVYVQIKDKRLKIQDGYENGISNSKFLISNEKSNDSMSNKPSTSNLAPNTYLDGYQPQYELKNLLKSENREDGGVIEENCGCPACKGKYSRAYISHLVRSNEILGMRLCTMHNLWTYLELVNKYSNYELRRTNNG